jgi:release factor glutamine methyltransferase
MRHTLPDQRTISELALEAQQKLATGPHPERARLDAETLLVHILQQQNPQNNRAWLLANHDQTLPSEVEKRFRVLIEHRLAGEPIQFILGETEFYGLPFHVDPDVLIPRPETEHLVEKALRLATHFANPRIVDIGTGSGVIAVALAAHLHNASITATDISTSALALARRNAERNSVAGRIRFVAGDLLAPIADEPFEIVVSNPPYVPETDRASLAVEVRDYEPAAALFAGNDGLAIYRRLIPAAFTVLVPGGFLALEIGYGQQPAVSGLLESSGFRAVEFTADLQGIPRVAAAQRP